MKSEIRYIFFIKRKVVQDESTIVKLNYLRSNYFLSIFQMSMSRHVGIKSEIYNIAFIDFFPVLIAQAGELPNGFSPYVVAAAVFWGIYPRLVRKDKPVFVPSGSIEKREKSIYPFPRISTFTSEFYFTLHNHFSYSLICYTHPQYIY